MKFDVSTPTRVVFGPGALGDAGARVGSFGDCALVVTGSNPSRADPLVALLQQSGITARLFQVKGEPTIQDVTQGVDMCRQCHCNMVIGFGGGSVIDAAKAIAAMTTNHGDLLDYLEVIGKGQPLTERPLPFVAIPTTAGTGSEITRNAVLGSPEHQVKVSLRSPLLLARLAVVDPELTLGLPPELTATTGMDALTQCIEAYVSRKANPFTDIFCVEGIRRAGRSLHRAFEQGDDLEARTDMALASLYSGMALANASLGAVHGFAGPLGGMFSAPHSAICAALLPHVMQTNLSALRSCQPSSATLRRFDEIARWLTRNDTARAEDGVHWLTELQKDLRIPRLGSWGIGESEFDAILPKAAVASSMKGNPLKLEPNELRAILAAAL